MAGRRNKLAQSLLGGKKELVRGGEKPSLILMGVRGGRREFVPLDEKRTEQKKTTIISTSSIHGRSKVKRMLPSIDKKPTRTPDLAEAEGTYGFAKRETKGEGRGCQNGSEKVR